MDKKLLQFLVCPKCRGKLEFASRRRELICQHCESAYPVRDGIPQLLVMDARRTDDR